MSSVIELFRVGEDWLCAKRCFHFFTFIFITQMLADSCFALHFQFRFLSLSAGVWVLLLSCSKVFIVSEQVKNKGIKSFSYSTSLLVEQDEFVEFWSSAQRHCHQILFCNLAWLISFLLIVFVYMFVLYCIVLYLSIYIAPLAVHTNQRRSQCERPTEKIEVLRQRKEALGAPVNKQERVKEGSWFHSSGPMKAKVRILAIAVLARGTKRSCRFNERSGRREVADAGSRIRSHRYLGAWPVNDR